VVEAPRGRGDARGQLEQPLALRYAHRDEHGVGGLADGLPLPSTSPPIFFFLSADFLGGSKRCARASLYLGAEGTQRVLELEQHRACAAEHNE